MDYIQLNTMLSQVTKVKKDKIENYSLNVKNLRMAQLRDIFLTIGKIYKEDIEKNIYIASVKGGFARLNTAVLVAYLNNELLMLSIYADEGIIKQNTIKGVVNEIKREIEYYTKK